jgi:putative ABC transport system permease protein
MRSMTHATAIDDPNAKPRGIVITSVMPGFFEAMSIPLRAGRSIGVQDRADAPKAAVLNETAARAFYQSGPAVGHRVRIGSDTLDIVGIASDVRSKDLASEPEPEIYRAYPQSVPSTTLEGRTVGRRLAVIARVAGDPRQFASTLRQQAQATGEPALVQRVRSLDDWIGDSAKPTRQRTLLLGLLGALGLVLAIIGVFGMTSYAVSQRTREIGVRIALGATAADVLRAVGGGAAAAIAIGLVAGLGATVWLTRAIASFLYDVTPVDPVSIGTAAAFLVGAATLAAYLPARRALRVDPVDALRVE